MSALALIETIILPRANYLLQTYTFEQFMTIYEGKKGEAKKEYDKIIKYLSFKVKKPNEWTPYGYAKGRVNGRLYGQNSIQGLKKEIRGFLTEGVTTDIDIVNCHPVILLELCLKHEFECPNLKLYVTQRDIYLKKIMECDNISREHAKKKVLASTNSNKRINSNCEFMKNYDKEMAALHKKFLEKDCYAYVKDFAKDEGNFEGSFINHILCINEEIILKVMRDFADENDLTKHSLYFDGLMLYGEINKSTLEAMEKHIHKNSDFKTIKLAIKEPNHFFKMPDDFIVSQRDSYNDLKNEFELVNCKVGHQFVCNIHNDFELYNDHNFKVLHDEMSYIDEEGKSASFISTWFKDKFKRKYDKFDCYPKDNLCPPYVYNMWEKFPVQLMPTVNSDKTKKGLDWFLNHIDVMVDYNKIHADFVKMWIAQMFQYPENKSIHLIFIGLEGSGKGTFTRFFETLMGGAHRCWECTDPQEDIFGKFNDMMKKAFLVILNEADKSGTYNSNNKMKALITEPTINIRPKGKTSFVMKSCHRFMSFSNNPDPNTKLKRRDLTFRMSDSKINNVCYFNEGNSYAKDLDITKAIYDYFMTYPTKPNIVESDIPKGEYDEMLKEAQKEPIMEWLEEFIYVNEGVSDYGTSRLFENYLDYCKREHIQFPLQKLPFTTRLGMRKYNGLTKKVKKINGKANRVWTFDFNLLKTVFNIEADEMIMDSDDEVI
jgi:G:T-mismatch repair DNA endonuclease (very short patch repair protein)